MEPTFRSLISVMEGQKEIYQELMSLAEQKQKELIKGSIEALDSLTKREEVLIYQGGRLEEERQHCAEQLIAAYQLPQDTTLKDLIQAAASQERSELEALTQKLMRLFKGLEKYNQENIGLIQQSLKYIDFSIGVITQQDNSATYTKNKLIKQDSVLRLLDKKA